MATNHESNVDLFLKGFNPTDSRAFVTAVNTYITALFDEVLPLIPGKEVLARGPLLVPATIAVWEYLEHYNKTQLAAFKAAILAEIQKTTLDPVSDAPAYFERLREIGKEELQKVLAAFPADRLKDAMKRVALEINFDDPRDVRDSKHSARVTALFQAPPSKHLAIARQMVALQMKAGHFVPKTTKELIFAEHLECISLERGVSPAVLVKNLVKDHSYITFIDSFDSTIGFKNAVFQKALASLYAPQKSSLKIPSVKTVEEAVNNAFLGQLVEEVEKVLQVYKAEVLATNSIDTKIHRAIGALNVLRAELRGTKDEKYEDKIRNLGHYLSSADGAKDISSIRAIQKNTSWISKVLALFGYYGEQNKVMATLKACRSFAATLAPAPSVSKPALTVR